MTNDGSLLIADPVIPLVIPDNVVPLRPSTSAALKPRPETISTGAVKEQGHNQALGGMRNPQRAVERLPEARRIGRDISNIIGKVLDDNEDYEISLLKAIGKPKEDVQAPNADTTHL